MTNSIPDMQIFNLDDMVIGTVQFAPDAGGQHARLSIDSQSLTPWDILSAFQQALKYTTKQTAIINGKPEALEYIEFTKCFCLPSDHKRKNTFIQTGDAPEFAVKELRFPQSTNGVEIELFRVFASAAIQRTVFAPVMNPATGAQDRERSLTSIDLSGNLLTRTDTVLLQKITRFEEIPSCRFVSSLKLRNCMLSDHDIATLIEIINGSQICQMELAGNNISRPNLEIIAAALRSNSAKSRALDDYRKETKATYDFDLPPLTEMVEYYQGQFVEIPVHGAELNLTGVDISHGRGKLEDNPLYENFRAKLAASNPTAIIYRDRPASKDSLKRFFRLRALHYSASVLKIDMSYSGHQLDQTAEVQYFAALLKNNFPNTKELVLDNNNFGCVTADDGYPGSQLGPLVSVKSLEKLSLRSCGLTDEDIVCSEGSPLTSVKASANLKVLDLSHNPITDCCAYNLTEWVRNSNITSINLESTPLSPARKDEIYAAIRSRSLALSAAEGGARLTGQEINIPGIRKLQRGKITITSDGQPLPGHQGAQNDR